LGGSDDGANRDRIAFVIGGGNRRRKICPRHGTPIGELNRGRRFARLRRLTPGQRFGPTGSEFHLGRFLRLRIGAHRGEGIKQRQASGQGDWPEKAGKQREKDGPECDFESELCFANELLQKDRNDQPRQENTNEERGLREIELVMGRSYVAEPVDLAYAKDYNGGWDDKARDEKKPAERPRERSRPHQGNH